MPPRSDLADTRPPLAMSLFGVSEGVINIGLEQFADTLESQRVPVVHVDWRPPAGGDERLAHILDKLT